MDLEGGGGGVGVEGGDGDEAVEGGERGDPADGVDVVGLWEGVEVEGVWSSVCCHCLGFCGGFRSQCRKPSRRGLKRRVRGFGEILQCRVDIRITSPADVVSEPVHPSSSKLKCIKHLNGLN